MRQKLVILCRTIHFPRTSEFNHESEEHPQGAKLTMMDILESRDINFCITLHIFYIIAYYGWTCCLCLCAIVYSCICLDAITYVCILLQKGTYGSKIMNTDAYYDWKYLHKLRYDWKYFHVMHTAYCIVLFCYILLHRTVAYGCIMVHMITYGAYCYTLFKNASYG